MATVKVSKSKLKRLNKLAKTQRLETCLVEEKSLRSRAEQSCRHWRDKADNFKRYIGLV